MIEATSGGNAGTIAAAKAKLAAAKKKLADTAVTAEGVKLTKADDFTPPNGQTDKKGIYALEDADLFIRALADDIEAGVWCGIKLRKVGTGVYAAALFAKLAMPDPLVGLAFATAVSALLGAVCSLLVLRGSDLTRLMVTLGVASIVHELANRVAWLTGGADGLQNMNVGKLLGLWEFDLGGRVAAGSSARLGPR